MMVLQASMGIRTILKAAAAEEAARVLTPTFKWAVLS